MMQRSMARAGRRQAKRHSRWSLSQVIDRSKLKLGLVVAGAGLISIGGWWYQTSRPAVAEQIEPAFVASQLEESWQEIIRQYERIAVGIEVWDIKSHTRASVNSLETFRAASVTKMITAAYTLSQVESGKVNLAEKLTDKTAMYWNLEQMIRWSNNESWAKIRDRLGRDEEQHYAKQLGLSSYNLVTNTISTDDMARFMLDLAEGRLIKQDQLDLLESYMTDTYEERFLPAAAPSSAVVYHKAGTLEDDVHEAAIITYKGRTYVMVVMTNGNGVTAYDIRANLYKELTQALFAAIDKPKPTTQK